MPAATFLASMALAAAESIGYIVVGYLLGRRRVEGDAGLASRLFSLWWYAIGVNKLLNMGVSVAFAYGWVGFDGYLAVLFLNLPILCFSLWALLYYMLYLFTGRRSVIWSVTALYAAYYVILTYNLISGPPLGATVSPWRVVLENGGQSAPLVRLASLALLAMPQLIAAMALLTLVRRLPDRTQRYRTLLVATAIIGWTLSVTLIAVPPFSTMGTAQLLARGAGLAAAFACLAAYVPPRWVRERLRVEPLGTVAPRAHAA